MRLFYTLGVYLYGIFIQIASLFNTKAKLFIQGRHDVFKEAQKQINPKDQILWFHAASLGEFEQGKPIIEQCKKDFPHYKILVTFFSPSGYELRKDYKTADFVFYLPLDTPSNMKRWLDIVHPEMVILIKYEFWFNLLHELHQRTIPTIVVSTVFRPDQTFFKPYGAFMLNTLKTIEHFFVQDKHSLQLLQKHTIDQVSISGDTRFDRVYELTQDLQPLPFLETFKNNTFTIVAGSTWAQGENFFVRFINETEYALKFILVPHEINPKKIQELQHSIHKKVLLYSEIDQQNLAEYEVLIIDAVGFLTSVYPYGDIAYIGGAYGTTGIHNILEPATFGKPVFYGPRFEKNQEAQDLVQAKGAKIAHDYEDFENIINLFYGDDESLRIYSKNAQQFIQSHRGATEKVMEYLREMLLSNS